MASTELEHMLTLDSIRTFKALKQYPGDGERRGERLRPRPDIALRFITERTSVAFDSPLDGDHTDRPIDYQVHPHVICELRNGVPTQDGFVFTERDELLRESIDRRSYLSKLPNSYANLQVELASAPIEDSPHTVAVLACQRSINYFHWWIDVLPRCWLLAGSPYRFAQLVTPPPTRDFQRESLCLLKQEVTMLTHPLQRFPSLVFTRGLTYGSSQNIAPQVVDFARWCRARLALSPARTGRKLVLSRRPAHNRRIVNEVELTHALGSDFECIELEGMSVLQQASLFSSAEIVVAPHGAALTNLLFCGTPTAVVELVHEEASPPYTYRRLAGLLGHPYIAVGCASEGTRRDITRRDLKPAVGAVVDAVTRLERLVGVTP